MLNRLFPRSFIYYILLAFSLTRIESKAETVISTATTNVPIEINCDSGIICERDKNICTAYGNVVVTHKEYKLNCDKLITYFRTTEHSKNELYKIEALGNAIMHSQDKVIEAEFLKANVYKNAVEKYEVKEIEAFNNVKIITQKEVSKAEYGHYRPDKKLIILKKDVRITNQEGQMHGPYAEVDLDKGISKMLMKSPTDTKGENLEVIPKRVKVLILPKAQKQ